MRLSPGIACRWVSVLLALAVVAVAADADTAGARGGARASEKGPSAASRSGVRMERGLRYARTGRARLDVFHRPVRRGRRAPAVLVVHGGGWRSGDKRRTAPIARAFARAGFVAFNVNYTLATRHRPGFPVQARELHAAVRWIRRHAPAFGVDRRRIGALGSSAGAHLVALLATATRGRLDRRARLKAVVTWSAPFDLASSFDTFAIAPAINTFVGCVDDPCPGRKQSASPLRHVSRDDPPMLIVNSDRELVAASQPARMHRRLVAAGVPARLWMLPGDSHASGYRHIATSPSIRFLRSRLR